MDRSVIVYFTSYGLSILGNSVAAIVLPLVVLQTTGRALDAGIVAAATAVPAVLAGLLMGSLVDRLDRRRMSILTDLVSTAAVAALPLIDSSIGLALGWFVLFGVIGSFGDVPGLTARETLLPGVQRRSGLSYERLVSLRESLGAVTMLIGPAIAAFLVVRLEGAGALWVTAGLAFAAALTTLLLPRDVGRVAPPTGAAAGGTIAHLREGWTWLFRRSPLVRAVTILNLALVIVLTALQGLILPVHFTSLGREGMLGPVLSALAAGMLVGSGAYALLSGRGSRRLWFAVSLVGSVGAVGLVAALPATAWILTGAVLLGGFGGVLSAVLGVVMIESIPDAIRGRVMGTQNAAMTGAPAIGVFGSAMMVEHTSITTAGVVVAVTWLVAVGVALVVPPLRRLQPA